MLLISSCSIYNIIGVHLHVYVNYVYAYTCIYLYSHTYVHAHTYIDGLSQVFMFLRIKNYD